MQYQVSVILPNNTQVFNKPTITTAELTADSPTVRGRVFDHQEGPLAGVIVTQSRNGFTATTDANGNLTLPVSEGQNNIEFTYREYKQLQLLNRFVETPDDGSESHTDTGHRAIPESEERCDYSTRAARRAELVPRRGDISHRSSKRTAASRESLARQGYIP